MNLRLVCTALVSSCIHTKCRSPNCFLTSLFKSKTANKPAVAKLQGARELERNSPLNDLYRSTFAQNTFADLTMRKLKVARRVRLPGQCFHCVSRAGVLSARLSPAGFTVASARLAVTLEVLQRPLPPSSSGEVHCSLIGG